MILAAIFAAIMFIIKEQPFKIVPKEKNPQVEEHEHLPGTPPHED